MPALSGVTVPSVRVEVVLVGLPVIGLPLNSHWTLVAPETVALKVTPEPLATVSAAGWAVNDGRAASTVRIAGELVTDPAELVATAVKAAAFSSAATDWTVRVAVAEFTTMLPSGWGPSTSATPFMNQAKVGSGAPAATTVKVAVPPWGTEAELGEVWIVGGWAGTHGVPFRPLPSTKEGVL